MASYRKKYEGKYKNVISYWGNRDDCKMYEKKIDKWLTQFDGEYREVALRLLSRFQMYRRTYLENKIKNLGIRLQNFVGNETVKSFFMLLNSSDRLANSSFFAFECKKVFKKVTIHQDIKSLTDEEIDLLNSKIVLIDDYIGSGDSFIKTVKFLIEKHPKMKDFLFILMVVNLSETGQQNIETFMKQNDLKLALAKCDTSSKAFKENYIFNTDEFESVRNKYKALCDKYHIQLPFGYKETESLIAFDRCIPNNNLATFRAEGNCEGKVLRPLFKRESSFKDDIEQLREQKSLKRRLESRSECDYEFRTQLFVLYCALQGKALQLGNVCKLFGFTFSQFNNKLNYVLENGLLIQDGERFAIGPNFENSFKNRMLINKIIKNILNGKIYIDEKDICAIINYTPVDFENRFKGYIEE